MRRLLCTMFGHVRHRRRARLTYEGWRSPCIFCRTPLIRVAPGDWRIYRKREPLPDLLSSFDPSPTRTTAADR